MSFSKKVKDEIINKKYNVCCSKALLYGILLFSNKFNLKNIKIYTENFDISMFSIVLLEEVCGVEAMPAKRDSSENSMYKINIKDEKKLKQIFDSLGTDTFCYSKTVIDKSNIANECCIPAFLAGAFLTGGQVKTPRKEYYLEYETADEGIFEHLLMIFKSLGYEAKHLKRGNNFVVYFKDSTVIEELLTYMGALNSAIEIMDVKIYKELRNDANRVTNCESANITKIVNASLTQFVSIEKLIKRGQLEFLPPELKEIALLRYENREASLTELGDMLSPRLSKSGVNHRLKKLIEIAEKL